MMFESRLHDHVRELERQLRHTAPATKADIDDIQERLARIEAQLSKALANRLPPQRHNRLDVDHGPQNRRAA